jgi:GNAT superfamily N-acetyltransferase
VTHIRVATPNDFPALIEIERASDRLLEPYVELDALPAPGTVAHLQEALVVLVAMEGALVGFARVDNDIEGAHLEQLSVHPDQVRRGIGRALLDAACQWAQDHEFPSLTLCTFAHVPFNGPFYSSAGFITVGTESEWLVERGLPDMDQLGRFGNRILMRKQLRSD